MLYVGGWIAKGINILKIGSGKLVLDKKFPPDKPNALE